jgi:hypothetical protein
MSRSQTSNTKSWELSGTFQAVSLTSPPWLLPLLVYCFEKKKKEEKKTQAKSVWEKERKECSKASRNDILMVQERAGPAFLFLCFLRL